MPARGASVVFGGFRWTVLEMAGPRIVSVRVDREPPAGTPAPSREAGPPDPADRRWSIRHRPPGVTAPPARTGAAGPPAGAGSGT
ncbi:MAG: hypothetical protein HYU25_13735 [Candidatus Rokubacteria bacterium]|nr:hypothetical protein [Candidatus Rokubacteria bacterium]